MPGNPSTMTGYGVSETWTGLKSVNWWVSILHSLEEHFKKNISLYHDDSLAVINTKSRRLSDKAHKDLMCIFNKLGLEITSQANQQCTNFLDLSLNLTNGTFKPYRKPNNEPLHTNCLSNHSTLTACLITPLQLSDIYLLINRCINT